MQRDGLDFTVDVTADGEGFVSHAGSVLLASLVLAPIVPGAFGGRGLAFAVTLVAIQIGRIVFIVVGLGCGHQLTRNLRRVLAWTLLSSVSWLAGGAAHDAPRVVLWLIAVTVDYTAPMHGFATPFLGRSLTREWTIDGGYLSSGALSAVRDHHLRGVDRENRHDVLCDQCALERCLAAGEVGATRPAGAVAGVRVGCFPDLYAALAEDPPDDAVTL